ncbi:hypothetical protein F5B18DRAFT_597331 [Nemania serpens]|nr:hypothetical protein F5B18DRAFT_597331 [Nemania serpens]
MSSRLASDSKFQVPTEGFHDKWSLENESGKQLKSLKAPQARESDGRPSVIHIHDLGFSVAPSLPQIINEHLMQDAMSPKAFRKHLSLMPKTVSPSVKESIKEKTNECLVGKISRHSLIYGEFLPIDQLNTIFSVESI